MPDTGETISQTPDQPTGKKGGKTTGKSGRIARTLVAVLLGTGLCWQISAAGVAALAARSSDPRLLATTGSAAHPQAGSIMAQSLLAAGQRAPAAALARSILLVDPTNDRAMRVLGLATEALGQRDQGAMIMRQAAALGWRDTPTQLWVLRDAVLRDDYVTVIQRADALARRNRSGELTQPLFRAAVTEPHLRGALADSLGDQPMWRGAFFADIRQNLPAASTAGMEALFRDMKARGQTIGPVEWLSYAERLIDLGQFQRARQVWASAFKVPASRLSTSPYDGNFALAAARPNDAPTSRFEWVFNPDLAMIFAEGPGGSSLTIPTDITGGTPLASQVVILPAGEHTLTARIDGSPSAAAAGWTITCLPSKQILPRRLARGASDELSSVTFDVPGDGCGAQQLALMTRDRLDAQSVTIGDVRIR